VADLCDDVIPATEQPVENFCCAKASIQAEHNPLAALPRPAQTGFQLAERRLQRWHRRRFPPSQCIVENLAVVTRRPPQDFPSCFAAIASHPGALTALGLGPNGQRGNIDIHPQQAFGEAMVWRLARALEIVPGHPVELMDGLALSQNNLSNFVYPVTFYTLGNIV
jgi:hypothetical protein